MQRRLATWLETSAPAVAAEPPFRPNGAGRVHTDDAEPVAAG
jgi:hypothetical protein